MRRRRGEPIQPDHFEEGEDDDPDVNSDNAQNGTAKAQESDGYGKTNGKEDGPA